MQALEAELQSLLKSLHSCPLDKETLDGSVAKTLDATKNKSSSEIRKTQWEYLLKNEIFTLAATEGKALKDPHTKYYADLRDRLDLVLTFTEHDVCEQVFPFNVLYDLLETQTIASCSHIFSWIEERTDRLIEGMVPQKGKALVLLRTLNDLLRRLSKKGATTLFCGRILTFLSRVFPLGERSGVNLRGEYGPVWDGPGLKDREEREKEGAGAGEEDKMQVDDAKADTEESVAAKRRERKEGISTTLSGRQLPFSRPTFFVDPATFPAFKEAVNKVLPVIKEATAKERALMGSKTLGGSAGSSGSLKRKRDSEPVEDTAGKDYFFSKYLTSPELLDLEIADTHFRRQFLFQLLIQLNHLLTFTKGAKASWSTPRNRSLQIDFTLDGPDVQWVQETVVKATEELRQTTPNGRAFAETVNVILEREKNWVRWKNELCAPFDREPWAEEVVLENGEKRKVGLEEATVEVRKKMRLDPPEWEHKLGSGPLTEIWEMGYRDVTDLQHPFQPGDVKDFVKKIKQEDVRIDMWKKQLAKTAERLAQARAKATAQKESPAKDAPAAALAHVTPSSSHDSVSSVHTGTLSTPRPLPTTATNPLHPSLPAKPGTTPIASAPHEISLSSPARVSTPVATVAPTPAPAPALPPAPEPAPATHPADENKQRWSWLALRTARDQYLQQFGKIGTGDIVQLAQEIEKEKKERERAAAGEEAVPGTNLRVLVTGGAGYIGSHVVFALQETRRFKVVSLDNNHNSTPKSLDRVAEIARSNLPADASEQDKDSAEIITFQADLTKPDEIRKVFEQYGKGGIWGVIHIAAYKAVGESTQVPLTYYANNVSATVNLLQIMSDFDCTRFVYSSSATVYGTPPVIPIPETTRLQAHSPYGKTKVMCETIIEDLCTAEPQRWQAVSLRYFNPGGAHPSGLIGEDPRGRPGNLFPLLAHIAIGRVKATEFQVFGDDYPTPDGTCVRDYLHVVDLARGHLLALEALGPNSTVFHNNPTEARYKAYNLGKGHGMSVLQIIEAMRKATGFDFKYQIVGRRRGDVPDLTADPSLAEKELGFKAPQDLETMCRDLWNWQTKNPQGYEGASA
ncbi:UDP-glucose 4-epimerase [Amylocystis lapponica]|nr:UDP-glucose 4-epimerase [Amylocystis lapponica]